MHAAYVKNIRLPPSFPLRPSGYERNRGRRYGKRHSVDADQAAELRLALGTAPRTPDAACSLRLECSTGHREINALLRADKVLAGTAALLEIWT
jgi:hypothetical protein